MTFDTTPVIGLVLHFRTPERTLSCLRSLVDEGVRSVVVVDNSEDRGRSVAHMSDALGGLRRLGVEIRLLTPEVNLGFARGIREGLANIGTRAAAHVLLINSDARLQVGALSQMMRQLGEAGVVAPRTMVTEGEKHRTPIVYYHKLAALYLRRPYCCPVAYPSGTCLLIRNDLIDPNLFDQDFFFYGEDVKLGYDLTRRGVGFSECTGAFVIHAGSASAKNGSMFYEYHMNRAHWLLARKLARNDFERIAFVCMRCITLPLRATVRSMRFGSLVPWRVLCAATADVLRGRCRSFTPPA